MGVERWGENQELQARFFKGANYSESSIDRLYLKLISSSFPLPPTVLCYLSGIILLSVKLPFSFPHCFTSKKYFKKGGKVLVNSEIPQGYCRLGCGCSEAQDGHSWALAPGVFHMQLLLAQPRDLQLFKESS